jgi:hypothetical protein
MSQNNSSFDYFARCKYLAILRGKNSKIIIRNTSPIDLKSALFSAEF